MIESPRPSRAEITDIYFAIQNNIRSFLVSNETAIGKNPIRCIQILKTMLEKN